MMNWKDSQNAQKAQQQLDFLKDWKDQKHLFKYPMLFTLDEGGTVGDCRHCSLWWVSEMNSVAHKVMLNSQSTTKMVITFHMLTGMLE